MASTVTINGSKNLSNLIFNSNDGIISVVRKVEEDLTEQYLTEINNYLQGEINTKITDNTLGTFNLTDAYTLGFIEKNIEEIFALDLTIDDIDLATSRSTKMFTYLSNNLFDHNISLISGIKDISNISVSINVNPIIHLIQNVNNLLPKNFTLGLINNNFKTHQTKDALEKGTVTDTMTQNKHLSTTLYGKSQFRSNVNYNGPYYLWSELAGWWTIFWLQ